jgi:hypothetical protein
MRIEYREQRRMDHVKKSQFPSAVGQSPEFQVPPKPLVVAQSARSRLAPPPVYRPENFPGRAESAQLMPRSPSDAPPVYRPAIQRHADKLQKASKFPSGDPQPSGYMVQLASTLLRNPESQIPPKLLAVPQPARSNAAPPPVYRPSNTLRRAGSAQLMPRSQSDAPPVYRPAIQRQIDTLQDAPPVYRPYPSAPIQRMYAAATNTWTGDRPAKPPIVKTANQTANVTDPGHGGHSAHHKYDYKDIKNEILDALSYPTSPGKLQKLENVARISGQAPVDSNITKELSDPYGRRSPVPFQSAVNSFMRVALWPPWDIFTGALSELRADDPTKTGAEVDVHFTASGRATPKSELARDIKLQGGLGGIDPAELTSRLAAIALDTPSTYASSEWELVGTRVASSGRILNQYKQKNDPQNWNGPQCEIIYPKDNQTITTDSFSIRASANLKTNNVEFKVQRVGTRGQWVQGRQTDDGAWWFDWHNIGAGSYEVMGRAWSETGQEWVSRRLCVHRS